MFDVFMSAKTPQNKFKQSPAGKWLYMLGIFPTFVMFDISMSANTQTQVLMTGHARTHPPGPFHDPQMLHEPPLGSFRVCSVCSAWKK
jgi:hypothetical protein